MELNGHQLTGWIAASPALSVIAGTYVGVGDGDVDATGVGAEIMFSEFQGPQPETAGTDDQHVNGS